MNATKVGPGSAIALAEVDRITVRGSDLCTEVIGHQGFSSYFLFLLGVKAKPELVTLVDACLVGLAEHGLVPSIQAARMTYAAAPEALQGAVAAGLLGCGSVVLGAAEEAGYLLSAIVEKSENDGSDLAVAAGSVLSDLRAKKKALPGFGHPLHKPEDPRALRLLELAESIGVNGVNMKALAAVRAQVPEGYGRHLPLNINGAIPAVLLDAGFPIGALKGIPLLSRTASLVAHLLEEQTRPIGFTLSNAGAAAIPYDGPKSSRSV